MSKRQSKYLAQVKKRKILYRHWALRGFIKLQTIYASDEVNNKISELANQLGIIK